MRIARRIRRFAGLLAVCAVAPLFAAQQQQTVCTVTVNSADEKQSFRRFLPQDKYRFVELVDRKRSDWLESACQAKVSCDVLIVSGHHGEGNVFFSDALDRGEHLDIKELERASCSGSCDSLFANLKEVYLFGCNTLNAQPFHSVSGEAVRSLVRDGKSPDEAARLARLLGQARGESSRDRMRLLFKDVPAIYGFSGVAPLGPVAGSVLDRHFRSSGAGHVGTGGVNGSLLRQFSQHGLVAVSGIGANDALMPLRQDICMFADDRMTTAKRLDSVHKLLQRPVAESRLLLDRMERFTDTLTADTRKQPEVAQALERIAADNGTRERYLSYARDADQFITRARMTEVAQDLTWLTPEQRREENTRMLADMIARKDIGAPDVDLACTLNKNGELHGAAAKLAVRGDVTQDVGRAAVLACLGHTEARERVLEGLVSASDAEVRIAQAYLRQRPITDPNELRVVTRAIAKMSAPEAQTRALDVLARHYVSDRESVDTLKQLFARTRSMAVQNAIAGVLIRADRSVRSPDLLRTLRENRLRASPGDNMVDALISRLQESS
ncbi:hypothetical protein [Ramlibacter albus]|uniref:HEAT repeat domain-containing protein n=1 Tax=Ramlibacter albus TaxID=2079448 RepID=A0A923MAK6_9BURK|nr:hypothetical protein [Ramlibacter albus]MBC5767100.1 hypothetical protein [Ramlibacter albus]